MSLTDRDCSLSLVIMGVSLLLRWRKAKVVIGTV